MSMDEAKKLQKLNKKQKKLKRKFPKKFEAFWSNHRYLRFVANT